METAYAVPRGITIINNTGKSVNAPLDLAQSTGVYSARGSCGAGFAVRCGSVSACARGFFSFLFSVSCFWGGRETSASEAGFSPSPAPPALPALWACRCVLHTAYFLCWSLRFVFLRCARDLFFFAGLCAVSDSQFCMSPIASEPPAGGAGVLRHTAHGTVSIYLLCWQSWCICSGWTASSVSRQ